MRPSLVSEHAMNMKWSVAVAYMPTMYRPTIDTIVAVHSFI